MGPYQKGGLKILIVAAAAALWISGAPSFSQQTPALESTAPVVEVAVPMEGKSVSKARSEALAEAKATAVKKYISTLLPEGIIKGRESEIEAFSSDPERWVISYEILREVDQGSEFSLIVRVELDQERLGSALKAAGLIPTREMPRVFLVVPGQIIGQTLPSVWDKSPGQQPVFSICEARLAKEIWAYGFEIIEPETGGAGIDTKRITAPQGEEEREAVLSELMEKYGAGALVVGRMEERPRETVLDGGTARPEGGGSRVILRIAAVDIVSDRVLWYDRKEEPVSRQGVAASQKVLEGMCGDAAPQVVEALFAAWMPSQTRGQELEIDLTIKGVSSYRDMTAVKNKIGNEGPGVKSVRLERLRRGEMELRVTTSAGGEAFGSWLSEARLGQRRIDVVSADEAAIEAVIR